MSLPLGDDEWVELEAHPHWKALVPPALTLIVTCGLASFIVALLPGGKDQGPGRAVVAVLAALVVLVWSLLPFLRWRSTRFVLTSRRLVTREGILRRRGHDLPLARVHDVSFSRTLVERMLGCGTLVVEWAGEQGEFVLNDIPRVADLQRRLHRLVEEQNRPHRGNPSSEESLP